MLGELNKKTNTYSGIVAPVPRLETSKKFSLVLIMQKIYLDCHLGKIENTQVNFLKETLSQIKPVISKMDLKYWEDYPQETLKIKEILLKAHQEAPL